jgi:hypothetical protein
MLFDWVSRILEFLYYRNIKNILKENVIVSKQSRLSQCTDYKLLINFFERPILEMYNKKIYLIFIFTVVISDRYIQGACLTLLWFSILEMKATAKTNLLVYLRDFIKEDWKIYGTAKR